MSTADTTYNFDELAAVLNKYRRVYFEPLRGNHGDDLIKMASRCFIADNNRNFTNSVSQADVVVINGGGGMTEEWGFIKYIKSYILSGAKAIIIFPSSIHVNRAAIQEIVDLSLSRQCKLYVFAREIETYKRLAEFGELESYLSHDMAFYLKNKDVLKKYLRKVRGGGYSLVVERRDAEGRTSINKEIAYGIPLKEHIPIWMKRPVKRCLASRNVETEFYQRCRDIVISEGFGNGGIVAMDVSSKGLVSFRRFVNTVSQADLVFTNRLHVCILRSILGKSCYLLPTGGEYRKNESIYHHSMAQIEGIKLL